MKGSENREASWLSPLNLGAAWGFAFTPGWIRQFGQGMVLGAALMLAIFYALQAVGALQVHGWASWEGGRGGLLLAVGGAVGRFFFFSGLEEALWRGFLLQELRRRMPLLGAAGLSSLGFSLSHLLNPHVQPLALVNLTLIGLWFALLFLRTGTIWLAWGAHFAYNLWESLICSLPVSGKSGFHLLKVTLLTHSPLTGGEFGPEGGWICTGAVAVACLLTAFLKGGGGSSASAEKVT